MSVLQEVADRAAADSPLWARALLPKPRAEQARFSGRCPERHLLGVEMIYEGYLLHYGRSRLFSQADADLALLTGDYLYAAGLSEICATGDLAAVDALADADLALRPQPGRRRGRRRPRPLGRNGRRPLRLTPTGVRPKNRGQTRSWAVSVSLQSYCAGCHSDSWRPAVADRRYHQLVCPGAAALLVQELHRPRQLDRVDALPPASSPGVPKPPSQTSSAAWMPCGLSSFAAAWLSARTAAAPAAHGARPGSARRADPPVTCTSVPEPRSASAAPQVR